MSYSKADIAKALSREWQSKVSPTQITRQVECDDGVNFWAYNATYHVKTEDMIYAQSILDQIFLRGEADEERVTFYFETSTTEIGIRRKVFAGKKSIETIDSPRPYRLGQFNDGTVSDCLLVLFVDWCNAMGHNPEYLWEKAYPGEEIINYETQLKLGSQEGVTMPKKWSETGSSILLRSLRQANYYELVKVLKEISTLDNEK